MSRRPLTVGIGVIALCAAVFLLQLTAAVLIPLVVSLLLFYALDPLVQRLVRWHVPRGIAAFVVMLAFVGGIGAGGWVLWPQIDQVVDDIPQGAAELRRELRRARGGDKSTLQRVQEAAKAIDAAAAEAASPPPRTPGVTPVEDAGNPPGRPTGCGAAARAPSRSPGRRSRCSSSRSSCWARAIRSSASSCVTSRRVSSSASP